MRLNWILAAVIVALVAAMAVHSSRMNARIAELETELETMDTNLKQFAMPMDNLRSDIVGIFAELDALESQRTRPQQTRAEPEPAGKQPIPEAREVWPPASSAPPVVGNGMVYTGDYGLPGSAIDEKKRNAPPEGSVSRFSINKVVDEGD